MPHWFRPIDMRKWIYGVFALLVIFAGLVLIPVFQGARPALPQTEDISNMKQLTLAVLMYASDADDHLPLKSDWADQAQKYTRTSEAWTRCALLSKKWSKDHHGHVLEQSMPTRNLELVEEPETLPLLFDGLKLKRNAVDNLANIRLTQARGQLFSTLAFADGHVKRKVFSPFDLN